MPNSIDNLVKRLFEMTERVNRIEIPSLKVGELIDKGDKKDLIVVSYKREKDKAELSIPPHILTYPILELSVEKDGVIANYDQIKDIHENVLQNPYARSSRLIKTIGSDMNDVPYALSQTGQLSIFRVCGYGTIFQKVDFRHFFADNGHPYCIANLFPELKVTTIPSVKLGYMAYIQKLKETKDLNSLREITEMTEEYAEYISNIFADIEKETLRIITKFE